MRGSTQLRLYSGIEMLRCVVGCNRVQHDWTNLLLEVPNQGMPFPCFVEHIMNTHDDMMITTPELQQQYTKLSSKAGHVLCV